MNEYKGQKLEDLLITLPLSDGTELNCGVYAAFEVYGNTYFALLPVLEDRQLDHSQSYMLYRVEEDSEGNPQVLYIEDDLEYNIAAREFSRNYLEN